jgi:hypothetical protein
MIEPMAGFLSDRPQGYYQALSDFGVLQLLSRIGNYSDRLILWLDTCIFSLILPVPAF